MKTYIGTRNKNAVTKVMVYGDHTLKKPSPLRVRLDLCSHSPDGFEWGYGGSGPAQLALALCADHFLHRDDLRAQEQYHHLLRELIIRLPYEGWELTTEDLTKVIGPPEKQGFPQP